MASKAIPLVAGNMTTGFDLPTQLVAIVLGSAGTCVIHDSTDASGPVVLAANGIGSFGLNEAVEVRHGIFVVLGGGATGSLLTS